MRQRDFIRVHHFETPRQRMFRMIDEVASEHGLVADEVMFGKRKREYVRARAHVWDRMRREGITYVQIARLFGMDHTTVIHGVRRHNGQPRP